MEEKSGGAGNKTKTLEPPEYFPEIYEVEGVFLSP